MIDKRGPAMASTSLVNTFLRQARAAHPDDNDERIAFLQAQLNERDEAVASGDWEVKSTSFAGESQSSARNIDSQERAAALARAIEIFEKYPKAKRVRGGVAVTRFNKIPH